jgi:hypothetical protein
MPRNEQNQDRRPGWLCAECYDQLEAAWEYALEHRDELVVVDGNGNRVA